MNSFRALFVCGLQRGKTVLLIAVAISVAVSLLVIQVAGSQQYALDRIEIGFVDRDGSAASKDLARYFTDDLDCRLVRSDDTGELDSALVDKRVSAIFEVPQGFMDGLLSGSEKPVVLTFMDDYANETFLRGYIDVYMGSLSALASSVQGAPDEAAALESLLADTAGQMPVVEKSGKDAALLKREADRDGFETMAGFLTFFSFIMAIGISTMLLEDRLGGTYRRVRAGRVRAPGYVLSIAAIGMLLSLVIFAPCLITYALSGADPGVSMPLVALLFGAYSAFVVAFGILVGVAAPSSNVVLTVLVGIPTLTSLISGTWYPIEYTPVLFQKLALATPQYWMFQALRPGLEGLGSFAAPLAVILLEAALCFILAGIRFTSNRRLLMG
ncbi:MAG: ABC transporter permease [Clostridiales Family XIII bacterium]|nr:ABC transporter permease [Clostridiales Family XIII bacterium]